MVTSWVLFAFGWLSVVCAGFIALSLPAKLPALRQQFYDFYILQYFPGGVLHALAVGILVKNAAFKRVKKGKLRGHFLQSSVEPTSTLLT